MNEKEQKLALLLSWSALSVQGLSSVTTTFSGRRLPDFRRLLKLEKAEFANMILFRVTDNVANIVKAISLLRIKRLACVALCPNLAVMEFIRAFLGESVYKAARVVPQTHSPKLTGRASEKSWSVSKAIDQRLSN